MAHTPEPSLELKAILKEFCEKQRAKYGPDWKKILAKQIAEKSQPFVEALLGARKPK